MQNLRETMVPHGQHLHVVWSKSARYETFSAVILECEAVSSNESTFLTTVLSSHLPGHIDPLNCLAIENKGNRIFRNVVNWSIKRPVWFFNSRHVIKGLTISLLVNRLLGFRYPLFLHDQMTKGFWNFDILHSLH